MIAIGQRIGSYVVVQKLGEGGMGAVYEAVQERLGRRVAIKVLHPDLSRRPEIVARFFNEARAVNIIQHPSVVGISEYGQLDDGLSYLVMELLQGEPLTMRLLRGGGRLGMEGLALGRQVALALAFAHDRGIVHRDLKPGNIMIVPDAEALGGERAKLLDFGIAKVAAEVHGPPQGAAMTSAGVILGTPLYMAPEQCRSAAAVTDRADVYSLGVLFYQMIAGRPPFLGEAVAELLAQHLGREPPPLSTLAPGTPEPLCQLVHRMLAKEPTARPSAREVALELERLGVRNPQSVPSYPGADESVEVELGGTLAGAAVLPRGPRPRPRWALPLLAALLLAGGAAAGVRATRGRSEAPVPQAPAPAPARKVRWLVGSEPAGAAIVRRSDGAVIGQTPWRGEHDAAEGALEVVLRREGYSERAVSIDLGRDTVVELALSPLPAAAPEPAAAPSPRAEAPRAERPRPQPAPRRPISKTTLEESDENVELSPLR